MSTFAIGDVHGHLDTLYTLLDHLSPSSEDTLIFLGDYIDRGPDSKGVLDYIAELAEHHPLITLKGNHEYMLETAYHQTTTEHLLMWVCNGGSQALDSFQCKHVRDIPSHYLDYLAELPLYHETDTHLYVHAGHPPDRPLSEASRDELIWPRFDELQAHQSGKITICGHTPQPDYRPGTRPNAICIDTKVYHRDGWLTALNVDTLEYHQADHHGATRSDTLTLPPDDSLLPN